MQRTTTVRAVLLAAVAAVTLAVGCTGILGIEDWKAKATGVDAGGSCLRASDCTGSQTCLFKICSEPCAANKDCAAGTHCLKASDGSACVSSSQAKCPGQPCPAGTKCVTGECRSDCGSGGVTCPGGQACSGGACVPATPDAGSGGASGSDGAPGTGGKGQGGAGGREPDSSVESGGSTGSGDSGTADAAGTDGGTVGPTTVGTLGRPCAPNGAYACAGHAGRGELVCSGGVWAGNGTCPAGNNCDTSTGNVGFCNPIVTECVGKSGGVSFCRGTERLECGVDLVTADSKETCPYVCIAGACSGQCEPAKKDCGGGGDAGGGVVPRTCKSDGTWLDGAPCAYLCAAATGLCVAAGCGDGAKNGDETDVDCGGSCGATCTVTQICKGNADCALPASGKCTSGKCAAAACNDTVKNADETDVDCGGTCGATCAVGKQCGGDGDCASSACVAGICTVCKPSAKQCSSTAVQTCTAAGIWGTAVPCTVANGTPSCTLGACGVASCTSGYANCDAQAANGCETNLNAPATCGTSCGNRVACAVTNGSPSCTAGVCGIASCTSGFGNCDAQVANGCEVNLNAPATCGTTCASRAACTVANGQPSCTAGVCGIQSCTSGFGNCDAQVANGCETNLNAPATCGTTCANRAACTVANGQPSCTAGVCGIQSCTSGAANCDGLLANGCETNLNSTQTCGTTCFNSVVCNLPNATPTCVSGACYISSCLGTYVSCDTSSANGCETDWGSSIANCGGCGRVCSVANGTPFCSSGTCLVGNCFPGFGNCNVDPTDGCETNLNDSQACGTNCQNRVQCSIFSTCQQGICGP